MPPHLHYVEPYFGGGSVLLAKEPEGVSEVANDLDMKLMNFWAALMHPQAFDALARLLQSTPVCESLWHQIDASIRARCEIIALGNTCLSCAGCFFVHVRQSLAGRRKCFSPLSRTRVRRGMNEQVSAWWSAIAGLEEVHARLARVVIRNQPALEVIGAEDGEETLFYLDPPYLHETRTGHTPQDYQHEMTDSEHFDLLETLARVKGKFLLSGYHSPMYDAAQKAHGWRCLEKEVPNSAAGGSTKRVMCECLWLNY